MTQQNFTEQQLREAIKTRLINGTMTKGEAKKAIDEFRGVKSKPEPTRIVVQDNPSFLDKVGNFFTGNLERTPSMEGVGHLGQTGAIGSLMHDAPMGDQIKFSALNLLTFNPQEIVKIATSMNPDISAVYNKDANGNVYPMLTNQKTGEVFMVNDPSLDLGDLGKFAGVGAAFSPAGILTNMFGKKLGAKIALGAGTSAATQSGIEGGQVLGGGDFDTGEVLLSGATGGGGELAGDLLGKAYRYTRQLLKGSGDEEALKLIAQAEQAGVPLMTTDVLKPETAMEKAYQIISERIPFIGTASLRADQKKARVDAVESLMSEFASDVGEDYAPMIINSLNEANSKKWLAAVAKRNSSEAILNEVGEVVPSKTQAMIADLLERETQKQLPDQGLIAYLEKLQQGIQPSNFSSIRESRSSLQGVISEMYKGQNSQVGASGASVLSRIVGAIDEDLTDFARNSGSAEAYKDWRIGNQLFRDEYQKLKQGALKNILDKGDIEPEVIRSVLKENKPSQSIRLYKNLTPEGKANVQRLLLQDAYNQATSNATDEFSADKFATALSAKDPIISVFFKDKDGDAVKGLVSVIQNTKRATQESAVTNTGMQTGLLGGIGAGTYYTGTDPILTSLGILGVGSIGRLIESPVARNILVKLASTPPQSDAYGLLVSRLTTVAQGLINEEE